MVINNYGFSLKLKPYLIITVLKYFNHSCIFNNHLKDFQKRSHQVLIMLFSKKKTTIKYNFVELNPTRQ